MLNSGQVMERTVKRNIVTLLVFMLLGGCTGRSEATCAGPTVESFFGVYEVENARQYRGGLTTEEQAKERIGGEVVLSETLVSSDFVVIEQPQYAVRCYPAEPSEGEVPTQKWSNFYGLGPDRDSIDVLEVYAENDPKDEPSYYFEIVDNNLWELFDGWVYELVFEE